MKKSVLVGGGIVIVVVALFYLMMQVNLSRVSEEDEAEKSLSTYESEVLKIGFSYPQTYFLVERELGNGERTHRQIALYADTQENRDVIAGKSPGREGPVAITFDFFQNNLDKTPLETWIKGSNDSDFKLSVGPLSQTMVSEVPALSYQFSGLYENDAVAFEHADTIIRVSVSYILQDEQIRKDFEEVLGSIQLR